MTEALDERVLVWAPRGRDGALAVQLLHKHGFVATAVGSLRELCEEIERGSGCAILTGFFKAELAQFLTPELSELGRRIIETCLEDGSVADYEALTPMYL